MYQQWEGQFEEWFANLKTTLTEDVVGNLLYQLGQKVDKADKATKQDALTGTDDSKWMTPLRVKEMVDNGPIGGITFSYYGEVEPEGYVRADGRIMSLDKDKYSDYLSSPGVQHWGLTNVASASSGYYKPDIKWGDRTHDFILEDHIYYWGYRNNDTKRYVVRENIKTMNATAIYNFSMADSWNHSNFIKYKDKIIGFYRNGNSPYTSVTFSADGTVFRTNLVPDIGSMSDVFIYKDSLFVVSGSSRVVYSSDFFTTYRKLDFNTSFNTIRGDIYNGLSKYFFASENCLYYENETSSGSNVRLKIISKSLDSGTETVVFNETFLTTYFRWALCDDKIYVNDSNGDNLYIRIVNLSGSRETIHVSNPSGYSIQNCSIYALNNIVYYFTRMSSATFLYAVDLNDPSYRVREVTPFGYPELTVFIKWTGSGYWVQVNDTCFAFLSQDMYSQIIFAINESSGHRNIFRPLLLLNLANETFYFPGEIVRLTNLYNECFLNVDNGNLYLVTNYGSDGSSSVAFIKSIITMEYDTVRIPSILGGMIRLT